MIVVKLGAWQDYACAAVGPLCVGSRYAARRAVELADQKKNEVIDDAMAGVHAGIVGAGQQLIPGVEKVVGEAEETAGRATKTLLYGMIGVGAVVLVSASAITIAMLTGRRR